MDLATRLYRVPKKWLLGVLSEMGSACSVKLWHTRAGHPGAKRLSILHKRIDDIPQLPSTEPFPCDSCDQAKASLLPFHGQMEIGKQVEDIVYSDFAGPFSTSRDGMKYFITFIDSFSRFTWVICSRTKRISEFFRYFFLRSKGTGGY